MSAEVTTTHVDDEYEEDGFEWTWPVIVLAIVILGGVIGLVCAFALHSVAIGAYVGIGVAAAIAPLVGMIFLAWAIDTDTNRVGAGSESGGH